MNELGSFLFSRARVAWTVAFAVDNKFFRLGFKNFPGHPFRGFRECYYFVAESERTLRLFRWNPVVYTCRHLMKIVASKRSNSFAHKYYIMCTFTLFRSENCKKVFNLLDSLFLILSFVFLPYQIYQLLNCSYIRLLNGYVAEMAVLFQDICLFFFVRIVELTVRMYFASQFPKK